MDEDGPPTSPAPKPSLRVLHLALGGGNPRSDQFSQRMRKMHMNQRRAGAWGRTVFQAHSFQTAELLPRC